MKVAGVAADGEPVALSAEGERVDGGKLVASSDLLYHLPVSGVENPDLNAFFGGGG